MGVHITFCFWLLHTTYDWFMKKMFAFNLFRSLYVFILTELQWFGRYLKLCNLSVQITAIASIYCNKKVDLLL
jgi:hypothetical protein